MMNSDTVKKVVLPMIVLAASVAIILGNILIHAGIERASDKLFAESSVDQKLDALYQQNKEIKQAIEECKVWILAK